MKNKLNMCAKQVDLSIENIYLLETLRFKAYSMNESFEGNTFYSIGITNGTMIPFGFYINDTLVAGCYVSSCHNSLYIEQLFVHPQLQNSGLRAGRLLLNYVLSQKEELEKYFQKKFTFSALEASNEKAKALYLKMGYVPGELLMRKSL